MDAQDDLSGDWTCPSCGERLDAVFDSCWSCGTQPDGTRDDRFESSIEVEFITHCRRCGYFLQGLTFLQCPGCGAATRVLTTKDDPAKPSNDATGFIVWLILIIVIMCVLGGVMGWYVVREEPPQFIF